MQKVDMKDIVWVAYDVVTYGRYIPYVCATKPT
jgi:hypothetical protein